MTTGSVASGRGRRSGGGAARRAERTARKIEAAKFIERKIPSLDLLNDEALEIIEANAELMLTEIGVDFVDNPGGSGAVEGRWRRYRGRTRKNACRTGKVTVCHRTCNLQAACTAIRKRVS